MGEMAGGGEGSPNRNDLFKREPVSYRVDPRSALAMDLRPFLWEQLSEYIGDLADVTLVDYIVVLLFNQKNQYQAREGLRDFLGENTDSFVARLWDFLSSKRDAMEKSGLTASRYKRMEVQRSSNEVEAHTGNTSLKKEGPSQQLKHHVGSEVPSDNPLLSSGRFLQDEISGGATCEGSLALEEELHGSVTPSRSLQLRKRIAEERVETDSPVSSSRRTPRRSLQKKLRTSITEEWVETESPVCSARRIHLETVDGSAPQSPYPEEIWHYKRGEKVHAYGSGATISPRSSHRPWSEVMPIGRNMKSSTKETLRTRHLKELPKLAMDKELKPVQRNVWDRLGKPQSETNNPFPRERINSFLPVPTATSPPIYPLVTENLPSTFPLIPHEQTHFASTSSYREGLVRTTSSCTPMRANREVVNKLKRQFEQIESHLQASAVTLKSEDRVPAKQRLGICVESPQPLPVVKCFSSNMAKEPVVVRTGLKSEIISNAESSANNDQKPLNTSREEQELENSESGNSDQKPQTKVLDMKAKLDEMENDMQELRSKHAQLENLKPDSETNPSSGAKPSKMEDVDSRTVLVTNVHFGATKEAIVSHFAKCGPVTKVIMLRDTITAKPKGAACVIFTKKESVEKAISLSGTSLFSRSLKVMRKADTPACLLEQPRQVWKQAQSLQLPPPPSNILQCYPATTHLQWRRETTPIVPKKSLKSSFEGIEKLD